jgi:hypothetical protein
MVREVAIPVAKPTPEITIDLNEILRRAVHLCEGRRNRTDIAFTFDLAENLPSVCIDRHEIEQILSALIVNAEAAVVENHGRPGKIHIKTAIQGKRVQITVMDNGRGIHWREMARLFGDQSRDVALTNCAETVKDHGGELYAWSSYGNGSAFTLELPVHRESGSQDCWFDETSEQTGLHGKRILVIDDEIHISTLLFDMLESQGAQIDLASSGMHAVEQIKTKQYDLFICDQRMPDLSGERLYRSVEAMKPELRDRFLFVTGDVLNDETENFFNETGVQVIRKPFRTVELVAAAEQVLSRCQRFDF